MAPKNKDDKPASKAEIKQAIKQASSDGITKKELQQITKQTGATSQQIVQQMDIINKNVKQAGSTPYIALNSGAANMLIRQAENQPQTGYDAYLSALTGQSAYGGGQIGKTIQSMIGSPGMFGQPATPGTGLMAGGGTIRPGGQPTYNPEAFFSRVDSIGPYNVGNMPLNTGTNDVGPLAPGKLPPGTGGTGGTDGTGGTGGTDGPLNYQSILDAIAGIKTSQFDMSALTDMFNTQFEQLRSEYASSAPTQQAQLGTENALRNPIQLSQIGRAYGGDAIRARQRNRKTARDYRRSSLGIASANPTPTYNFSGGLTL